MVQALAQPIFVPFSRVRPNFVGVAVGRVSHFELKCHPFSSLVDSFDLVLSMEVNPQYMLRNFYAGGIHVGWASVKLILKACLIFLCGTPREREPLPDEIRNCERSFELFLERTAIIAELLPFFGGSTGIAERSPNQEYLRQQHKFEPPELRGRGVNVASGKPLVDLEALCHCCERHAAG